MRSHAGDWRHLEFVGVDLLDHPAVGGIVLTGRDTTDRDLLAAELAHLASTTRCRASTIGACWSPSSPALARAGRLGTEVAVCFIDLDRFKAINDRFGHAVGDDVIVEVGRRLQGRFALATSSCASVATSSWWSSIRSGPDAMPMRRPVASIER